MTDHAELARLAEAAMIPIPEKRRKSWFNRQRSFRETFNPARVLALLAENAALRAKAALYDTISDKLERRTFDLDQAERQRDEAVGLVRYLRAADGPGVTHEDRVKQIDAFLASMEPKT